MASTAEFRNGLVLDLEGTLFQIVSFQHVKPGKGGAFVRTRLKNPSPGPNISDGRRTTQSRSLSRTIRSPSHFEYR